MTFSLKPLVAIAGRVATFVGAAVRGAVHSVRFWVLAILAVIVVIIAYYVVADRLAPLTTDAYLQAYVVQVAPQVGGQVVHVHVNEGDRVAKGSLLFELDARPFQHKMALLEAKLVEARQQVKRLDAEVKGAHAEHLRRQAEADFARVVFQQEKSIFDEKSTTYRKKLDAEQKHKATAAAVQQSEQNIRQATDALDARVGDEHALVAQVQAQLAEARLNLEYTKVYAPCDGIITDLQLREGAYAHVGQAVLACIDTGAWIVVANFRENSLLRMKPGQPALRGVPGRAGPVAAGDRALGRRRRQPGAGRAVGPAAAGQELGQLGAAGAAFPGSAHAR